MTKEIIKNNKGKRKMENEAKIRILDNGSRVVLEDGCMLSDGSRVHIAIIHRKDDPQGYHYDVDNFIGEYNYDMTGRYLYDYLAWFRYLPEDDEDTSVKFTELWYEVIDGEFVEMKRQETSYSDVYIKQKLKAVSFPSICFDDDEHLNEDDKGVLVPPPHCLRP